VVDGVPFTRPYQTVLDGSGAGQITATPPAVDWLITGTQLEVGSHAHEPTAQLSRNGRPLPGGQSYHASNDQSSARYLLTYGDVLTCDWADGDAGAIARLVLTGMQYPPGQAPPDETAGGFDIPQTASLAHELIHMNEIISLGANGNFSSDIFPVFDTPGTRIFFISQSNFCQMDVRYFLDPAGLIPITRNSIVIGAAGSFFDGVLPARGPYVGIDLSAPTAVGTDVQVELGNGRGVGMAQGLPTGNVLMSKDPVVINGGATNNFDTGQIWLGWLSWLGFIEATVFDVRLQALDVDGNATTLDMNSQVSPVAPRLLFVPAMPLRVRAHNGDGVARNFRAFLTAHPLSGDF